LAYAAMVAIAMNWITAERQQWHAITASHWFRKDARGTRFRPADQLEGDSGAYLALELQAVPRCTGKRDRLPLARPDGPHRYREGPADAPDITLIGAGTMDQVIDIDAGADELIWRIETSSYSVEWSQDLEIDIS
jgi:hypothetical protein